MGHTIGQASPYRLLQERLDRNVTGAPDTPTFTKILQLLYSPEEAELVRHVPGVSTPAATLAKKLDMTLGAVEDQLGGLAERGLMIDLEYQGQRYFQLPPVVIGLFEFTFMRTGDQADFAQLAPLFDEYLHDVGFARSVFAGSTQIGRAVVRDEALPAPALGDHSEVLDWERAAGIVAAATTVHVSPCSCRHKASHLGKACDREQRTCLSFNYAADFLTRVGIGEAITKDEALRILQGCKEAGLAQIADNVQRKVSYICNCCGCCCGMVMAMKTLRVDHAIVTSNWIPVVDEALCTGCGKCAKVCPLGAMSLAERPNGDKPRKVAERDAELCIGCGVCASECTKNSLHFHRRQQRVYTPDDVFERIVAMAIERQKLAGLLFPERDALSSRALGRVVEVIERSTPGKAALAVAPLRSVFLNGIVKAAVKSAGPVAEYLH